MTEQLHHFSGKVGLRHNKAVSALLGRYVGMNLTDLCHLLLYGDPNESTFPDRIILEATILTLLLLTFYSLLFFSILYTVDITQNIVSGMCNKDSVTLRISSLQMSQYLILTRCLLNS